MKVQAQSAVDLWANGRRLPDPARAAGEFEAMLIAEVWKQSARGPRFSKLLGAGAGSRMGQEMWIEELIGRAVEKRGLGLARALTRQDGAVRGGG